MTDLPQKSTINHQDSEDLLTVWLVSDEQYLQTRAQAFEQYQKRRLSPTQPFFQKTISIITMTTKNTYLSIAQLFVKHTAVAITSLLICIAVAGAVGAEAMADAQFKPTTLLRNLFTANTQTETDPYSPLSPDSENAVASLAACDLSIKFPRTIFWEEIAVFATNIYTPRENYSPSIVPRQEVLVGSTSYYTGPSSQVHEVILQCFEADSHSVEDFIHPAAFADGTDMVSTQNLSRDELRSKYGWFITEADISNISLFTKSEGDTNVEEIFFEYNNLLYRIISTPPATEKEILEEKKTNEIVYPEGFNPPHDNYPKGIFSNQIQIQFNSLVTNESDTEIQNLNERENAQNEASEFEYIPKYLTPVDDSPRNFGIETGKTITFEGIELFLEHDGKDGYYSFSNSFTAENQNYLVTVRFYDDLYDRLVDFSFQSSYVHENSTFINYLKQPRIQLWGEAIERLTPEGSTVWEMTSLEKIEILPTLTEETPDSNPADQISYVLAPKNKEQFLEAQIQNQCNGTLGNSHGAMQYSKYEDEISSAIVLNSFFQKHTNDIGVQEYYILESYIENGEDVSGEISMSNLTIFRQGCSYLIKEAFIPGEIVTVVGSEKSRTYNAIIYQEGDFPGVVSGIYVKFDISMYGDLNAASEFLRVKSRSAALECGGTINQWGVPIIDNLDAECFENKIFGDSTVQVELERLQQYLLDTYSFALE